MRRALALTVVGLVIPSIALAGYEVSSFKRETRLGENTWNAQSALDSDPKSCWMVDPESENVGESFTLDVPKGTVEKIAMMVGWEKSDEAFADYARVKQARVELYTAAGTDKPTRVAEHTVSFEDKRGWQVVSIPPTEVGNEYFGGRIKIVVTEIYPGRDYPNLAVSELLIHLKEIDVPVVTLRDPPSTETADHDGSALVDGSDKTFWLAEGGGEGATFGVAASGWGASSMALVPGPAGYARPKTVEVSTLDGTSTITLPETGNPTWIQLPVLSGYTGSAWGTVTVTIKDTYPGKTPQLALSEVKMRGTNFDGM